MVYLVYVSNEKLENCVDLFLIIDENKPHYVYIKKKLKFICNKTKNKNKKHLSKYCLQCFSSQRVLIEHKEPCFKINGKQSVEVKKWLN